MSAQPTATHIDAMRRVYMGADIRSYFLAGTLREVEQKFPELISIGDAMAREYGVHEKHPYFGAILTVKGREVVDRATGGTATVRVIVRHGDPYRARAGKGKKAKLASSTSAPKFAALRASAKFFGCQEDEIALELVVEGSIHRSSEYIADRILKPEEVPS